MRVTNERKAETRQRILTAAEDLFRGHGIDGVGVDAIMQAAGLTHGGFYAHFGSKDALVAEVLSASLARSASRWQQISEQQEPVEALARIVESYLDPSHIAKTEGGCVLPSLGPEMARRQEVRPAITRSVRRMLAALAQCLPRRRRERSTEILAGMVGAVVLARLCDDGELAQEFLRAAQRIAGLNCKAQTGPK